MDWGERPKFFPRAHTRQEDQLDSLSILVSPVYSSLIRGYGDDSRSLVLLSRVAGTSSMYVVT